MVIERYSHVMHITSNVTGRLRNECDAFDALAACLPAGTVSGAPKVRAMEIIDEIEPHRRGPMQARSATSTSPATWIPASRCERWCSRTT